MSRIARWWRWRLARLCYLWLYRVRRYEEGAYYANRLDCLVGRAGGWLRGTYTGSLWRHLRAAWREPLSPHLARFR